MILLWWFVCKAWSILAKTTIFYLFDYSNLFSKIKMNNKVKLVSSLDFFPKIKHDRNLMLNQIVCDI